MPKANKVTPPAISAEAKAALLELYQAVVAAKVSYWEAIRAVEKATVAALSTDADADLTDLSNDVLDDDISSLAAGLDAPEEAFTNVTLEHLDEWLAKARVTAK
jgi:hypothetical protein